MCVCACVCVCVYDLVSGEGAAVEGCLRTQATSALLLPARAAHGQGCPSANTIHMAVPNKEGTLSVPPGQEHIHPHKHRRRAGQRHGEGQAWRERLGERGRVAEVDRDIERDMDREVDRQRDSRF